MKLQYILNYLFPFILYLLTTALEHEKSFLKQDRASTVWAIAIYEDSLLLTSSNDIVQKDIQTGAILRTFRAHKKAINSFVVTNDSRMITSAFDDMIIVWSLETGSILKRIWLRSSGNPIQNVFYKEDQVFTGGTDGIIRQVDLLSGKVVNTIPVFGQINCVAAANSFLFVGTSRSPFILKLSIESGNILQSLYGHFDAVSSLFFLDNLLFSGSNDYLIICWNTANGEIVRQYVSHAEDVNTVAVFDGELYSAGAYKELFKWNINDGEITKRFPVSHENDIVCMAFRSKELFTGSLDSTVIKWDAASGDFLFLYTGRYTKLRSIVSWRDFIITGGDDEEIRMWDASIDSIEPFAVFDNGVASINILYLVDDYLYSGDTFGKVNMMSLTNFTLIRILEVSEEGISSLAADKSSLYIGGYSGSIHHWNNLSGVQVAIPSAHSGDIASLEVFDDILYSGSEDATAKAWNTQSLENVGIFAAYKEINAILVEQENLIVCTSESVEKFSILDGTRNVFLIEASSCYCIVSRGNSAFSGHDDSLIRVRSLELLIPYETFSGHLDSVNALCFDIVSNLYSVGYDGAVKKWNMASRSVAYSFESKNDSVSSFAVQRNQLFVGLRSGNINCYNKDSAIVLNSLGYHTKAVSSLIVFNGSIYSSGFDGKVLKFSTTGDGNFISIYDSHREPLRDLFFSHLFWIVLQGDSKIVFSPIDMDSGPVKIVHSQTPLVCIAATKSVILAGSKSGTIYAWDINTLQQAFELKGHVSPVNDFLVVDDRLFSASDDKTIIEWSLEEKSARKTFQRLSAATLGHLGPVNSLSYCSDTLFSAGSDLTVRRWNTIAEKHEDVYFGFTKSVTTVVCYNSSVSAGSEDFSVLMFTPSLPENQDVTDKSASTIVKKISKQKKIVKLQKAQDTSIIFSRVVVSVCVVLALIILIFCGHMFLKKRSKKIAFETESTGTLLEAVSAQTVLDLKTVVNSVMGISKHAAYLIENSSLAKVKKIAAGGGGELYLAKVMDPGLRKKVPEIVVQKIVFVKSKTNEEAFYQEVGIMILLSTFPYFCQIIGYTENPLSMIMKNYPNGSLYDWLGKNNYGTKVIHKILKEVASAISIMHSHYLAHCDLKTQNILVELDNGVPCCHLTDFGITHILSDKIIATKAFQVINLRGLSVHYAAPEAFLNFRSKKYVNVEFKAYDIYSFGCLLYEVVARKSPWK